MLHRAQQAEELFNEFAGLPDPFQRGSLITRLLQSPIQLPKQLLLAPEREGRLDGRGGGGKGQSITIRPGRADLPVSEQSHNLLCLPLLERQARGHSQSRHGRLGLKRCALIGMCVQTPGTQDFDDEIGLLTPFAKQDQDRLAEHPCLKENTNLAGHQPAHSLSLWYPKDGQALGVRHRGLASRRVAEKHMFHGAQSGRPLARATHLRLDKSLVEQSGANRCGREINLPDRGVRLARQGDLDRPAPPQGMLQHTKVGGRGSLIFEKCPRLRRVRSGSSARTITSDKVLRRPDRDPRVILSAEPGQQLTIANVGRPFRGFNGIRIARTDRARSRWKLGDRPGPDSVSKPPAVSRPVDGSID